MSSAPLSKYWSGKYKGRDQYRQDSTHISRSPNQELSSEAGEMQPSYHTLCADVARVKAARQSDIGGAFHDRPAVRKYRQ